MCIDTKTLEITKAGYYARVGKGRSLAVSSPTPILGVFFALLVVQFNQCVRILNPNRHRLHLPWIGTWWRRTELGKSS
jgi:hypothetical protein